MNGGCRLDQRLNQSLRRALRVHPCPMQQHRQVGGELNPLSRVFRLPLPDERLDVAPKYLAVTADHGGKFERFGCGGFVGHVTLVNSQNNLLTLLYPVVYILGLRAGGQATRDR